MPCSVLSESPSPSVSEDVASEKIWLEMHSSRSESPSPSVSGSFGFVGVCGVKDESACMASGEAAQTYSSRSDSPSLSESCESVRLVNPPAIPSSSSASVRPSPSESRSHPKPYGRMSSNLAAWCEAGIFESRLCRVAMQSSFDAH